MRKNDITELFEGQETCLELDVSRHQWVEEVCKLMGKVLLVCLLFWVLNWVGEYLSSHKDLIQGGFDSGILFSVFVLPLLYSLKDIKDCFSSLFIKIWQDDTAITVKRGWLWKKYDKLYFKDLNNIELYQSFGGKLAGYCSLDLYAVGGIVSLPNVKYTEKNKKAVTKLMTLAKQNQATEKTNE